MSQNMNPLELIWDVLGRGVRRHYAPSYIIELPSALVSERNNWPNHLIKYDLNSMGRRVDTVIRLRGGPS